MEKQQESDETPVSLGLWNQVRDKMEQENNSNESPSSTEFELTNDTECTNLQQMVEDCLREIFSSKTLSIMDLCSIAETCKRFREITQSIFPRTINIIIGLDEWQYIIELPEQQMWMRQENVKRIFENFGSNLSEVEIWGGECESNTYLFPLVMKHCRAGNLKSLTIKSIDITEVSAVQLKPVIGELERLHIYNVCVAGGAALFSELNSLTDLKLVSVTNCSAILENIFMKLERFEIIPYSWMEETLETLSAFLSRHQSLKILSLSCLEAICENRRVLQVIIDSCCNALEELSIYFRTMTEASLLQLNKFSSLRALELAYVSFENFKLFSAFTKLRKLVLFNCKLPTHSDQFVNLSQLTFLKLEFKNRSIDLVGIISQLINLQEMEIFPYERSFVLNEKTFSRIVDIVKDRPHVLHLTSTVDFTVPNYDGKQRARLYDSEADLVGYYSGDDSDDGYLDVLDWRLP